MKPAQLNVRIPHELDRKLEKDCVAKNITKKDVVIALLKDYLEKRG